MTDSPIDGEIMKTLKQLLIACSFLIGANHIVAQMPPPSEPLRISVDFARFRGDDNNVYVEVYYSVAQRMLSYTTDTAGYKAGVELLMSISAKDSIVLADRLLMPHTTKDTITSALNLVSLTNMMLPEGEYRLKVVAKDVNDPSRRDSAEHLLSVRVPKTKRLILSDIELASLIRKGAQTSPFYKNTLEVIPNADGVFSHEQSCYYYAEAYNLLEGEDRSDYLLKASIHNSLGKEIISRERPRKRAGESAVLVDQFDVSTLRSGTYTLVLAIYDSTKKLLTSSAKKFFVYNATLGIDSSMLQLNASLSSGVYAVMNEADLDREFNWSRWEANETEKAQYTALQGAEAKRKFLTEFWSKRPAGKREQYLQRVAYANRHFNIMGREGYRTDRGRVHIVYGPPDDIERHPSEAGTRPYEIWSYNSIQGGVIFVFLLRREGGDYELVHSTHRNELYDENWMRYAETN